VARLGRGIGVATNNVAEYQAAIEGLKLAQEHGAASVILRADSKLLIEQLSGRFRVKNPTLIRLHEQARKILARFESTGLEHIPRERNREADRLANAGVDEWLAGAGRGHRPPEAAPDLFD
jgi:probable phosphoglycerate mutase